MTFWNRLKLSDVTGAVVSEDQAFTAAVLSYWAQGFDTYEIGKMTGHPEHVVYRALHKAKEQ